MLRFGADSGCCVTVRRTPGQLHSAKTNGGTAASHKTRKSGTEPPEGTGGHSGSEHR